LEKLPFVTLSRKYYQVPLVAKPFAVDISRKYYHLSPKISVLKHYFFPNYNDELKEGRNKKKRKIAKKKKKVIWNNMRV
jgi:hypothetical protein